MVAAQAAELATQNAMLAARDAELAAARAGIVEQRFEIEALKARLARALRVAFGRSSEKLRDRIEQLELTLADACRRHRRAGAGARAGQDTDGAALDPRLRRGRLYVRDDRPFGGTDPPAALYRYSPDRKGEHPREHLRLFRGILQADGYAGFAGLYGDGRVIEAACLAHARRKFWDVHEATKSPSPARHWTGLPRSTGLRRRSADARPISACVRATSKRHR